MPPIEISGVNYVPFLAAGRLPMAQLSSGLRHGFSAQLMQFPGVWHSDARRPFSPLSQMFSFQREILFLFARRRAVRGIILQSITLVTCCYRTICYIAELWPIECKDKASANSPRSLVCTTHSVYALAEVAVLFGIFGVTENVTQRAKL